MLFSIEGEIPDFEVLEKLKEQFDLFLIADEAHAFGILGGKGSGLACGHADITSGTFRKVYVHLARGPRCFTLSVLEIIEQYDDHR